MTLPLRTTHPPQVVEEKIRGKTEKVVPKPAWLKIKPPANPAIVKNTKESLSKLGLATVCQEAKCPNIGQCWSGNTATFMVMGDTCTRGCKFCNVKTGLPQALDPLEPQKVAFATKKMGLDYVVITSVDRDELPDQGAEHFAKVITIVKQLNPGIRVEVLIPDFRGKLELVDKVIAAGPEVIAHNVETVPRLQRDVRDFRANYEQSKKVLQHVKKMAPNIYTKSALMLGLGEEKDEVIETLRDLRQSGIDMMTLGQYLRPSKKHLPVKKYVSPEEFAWYKQEGDLMGYIYVIAGPFIRSSYRAGEYYRKYVLNEQIDDI